MTMTDKGLGASLDRLASGGIGWAVMQMQAGAKVRRRGWHKRDMFIVLMTRLQLPSFDTQHTERRVNDRTAYFIGRDVALDSQPYVALCVGIDRVAGIAHWQPGWLCSQADLLATDWETADDEPSSA